MDHPVVLSDLSPQAAMVIGDKAPPKMKMAAATGLLPLGPTDLISVLYVLSYSNDKALADKALNSLQNLPDNILLSTLEQKLDEGVIDGLAHHLISKANAIEKILLNPATADETACWITTKTNFERLLEIVAANEERMLRHQQIIEALYMNKAARMSTVDRAIELAIRNGLNLTGIPTFAEAKAAIEGQLIIEPSDEPSPTDLLFNNVLEDAQENDIDEERVHEVLEAVESGEEIAENSNKQKVATIEATLSQLSVSEKIRMAMLGNASQRAVLARSSNKLVTMAVLKSPAVSESEIMRFTKARSLPEEAIRYIAHRREWTKHYQIKLNLVNNPRTPLQDSLHFLSYLRLNDIKLLERSRDVPSAIASAAKQLRQKRTK